MFHAISRHRRCILSQKQHIDLQTSRILITAHLNFSNKSDVLASRQTHPSPTTIPQHEHCRYFSSKNNDEWIPPDHLADKISIEQHVRSEMLPDIDTDTIEVIDIEATLNNPSNKLYLDQLTSNHNSDEHQIAEEDFGIETSEGDWDEILMDLRDSGDEEKLRQIVQEYGLEDRLARLENKDNDETDIDYDSLSLDNLSEEELINELIESSASLSQLEMEIMSQELNTGLDIEDDEAVKSNSAIVEFRKMVLEDYNTEKQKRQEERNRIEAGTTTALDYSVYPQDWKDYDSSAAFSRDFLEEEDSDSSWIPPAKEFIPSKEFVPKLTINEEKSVNGDKSTATSTTSSPENEFDNKIDWLQARRSRLQDSENNMRPLQMLTPDEAEAFRHENAHIPIVLHTLFTTSELSNSLSAQGGMDIHIIDTADFDALYGVGLGCNHLMIVTGRNTSHCRVLADSVVRNLKDRKLHERGVVGAMKGPEGGTDIFSNKPNRNRANRIHGQTNLSAKVDDDWFVVDCGNIHVHILESDMRKCLNIEGLWDLDDPNSEGSKLRRVNFDNEDEGMHLDFTIYQCYFFDY